MLWILNGNDQFHDHQLYYPNDFCQWKLISLNGCPGLKINKNSVKLVFIWFLRSSGESTNNLIPPWSQIKIAHVRVLLAANNLADMDTLTSVSLDDFESIYEDLKYNKYKKRNNENRYKNVKVPIVIWIDWFHLDWTTVRCFTFQGVF